MPPTIITANGFCTSEPIPVERAAGSNPAEPINEIISTARRRMRTASSIAKPILRLCCKSDFISAVSKIELIDTIPNKMINPIPAEIPNGMPATQSEINPPIKA